MSKAKLNSEHHEKSSTEPLDEVQATAREIRTILQQNPSFNAAVAMTQLRDQKTSIDLFKLKELLVEQSAAVSSGNLDRLEEMLTAQSHVLDNIFEKYIGIASKSQFMEQFKGYIDIALKAQNQCRQTIAVLGDLKNPKRTTIVNQQNNAINQQINQGEDPTAIGGSSEQPKSLENIPSEANKLLEIKIEQLDQRTSAKTK